MIAKSRVHSKTSLPPSHSAELSQKDVNNILFWLRLTRLLQISTFFEHCSLARGENSVNLLIFFFSLMLRGVDSEILDVLSDLREVTE